MRQLRHVHRFSLLILIILAIFGTHFHAFSIGSVRIFLYVVYFVVIQIPLTLLFIRYKEKIYIFQGDVYISLFLIYIFISTLFITDDPIFIGRLGVLAISIGITLIISVTATRRFDQYFIINTVKAFTLIMILFGFVTTVISTTFLGIEWFKNDTLRSRGWYSNRNNLSYFLSLISAFFLSNVFNAKYSFLRRTIELTVFVLISTIILINESRAAMIAQLIIVGSVTLLSCMSDSNSSTVPKQFSWIAASKRKFTIGLLLLPLTLFIVFTIVENPFTKGSLHTRWNLHAGAFQIMLQNPLGAGISNYRLAIIETGLYPDPTGPHSWFAHIIAEFGIIGIILFMLKYGLVLDSLFKISISDGDPLLIALFASLASFSFSGLSPANPLTLQLHWIIIGLAFAAIKSNSIKETD